MRNLLNLFNIFSIVLTFIASVCGFDLFGFFAAILLVIVNPLKRCPSVYYIYLIFGLYYSIRYFSLKVLGFDYLFDLSNQELNLGLYYLISTIFYSFLIISINYSSIRYRENYDEKNIKFYGFFGKLSIIIFSISVFSGAYSIGKEIESFVFRFIVRIGLFFQYFQPFIFLTKARLFYLIFFSVSLILFGSKAFIFSIMIIYLYYSIIFNLNINYVQILSFLVLLIVSIAMFDVISNYRTSRSFDFNLSGIFFDPDNMVNSINVLLFKVGQRFGGLDTLLAYGVRGAEFTLLDIFHELIISINNFSFYFKIPLPDDFIPSELRTAFIFRDYIYNDHLSDIRHTDSMFGLSRFVSVDFGFGELIFLICLVIPFIAFRSGSYYLDVLFKMYFFGEVLIGGSFSSLFRLMIELFFIYFFLKLKYIRRWMFR